MVTPDNFALGTLCVIDQVPRELGQKQIQALTALARQVICHLELRRQSTELRRVNAEQKLFLAQHDVDQTKLAPAAFEVK